MTNSWSAEHSEQITAEQAERGLSEEQWIDLECHASLIAYCYFKKALYNSFFPTCSSIPHILKLRCVYKPSSTLETGDETVSQLTDRYLTFDKLFKEAICFIQYFPAFWNH